MTRFSNILTFILLFISVCASAQGHTIKGKITSVGDADVMAAFVMVKSVDGGRVFGYASPDAEGYYHIDYSCEDDRVVVVVQGMGIKSISRQTSELTSVMDFRIEAVAFSLKEVKIKAEKIEQKEDTVKYNVQAFKAPEDRVIEDVLKRMPGISVLDGGKILYKGKPVNLTIDGLDMLGGRYAIATKNISPDHIATVEILENHQVIKALKGLVPSDLTTLNLKLKASSRGVFLLSLGGGLGYGDDWNRDVEGAGMYFGHRSQHIVTAKTNDIGSDLRYELTDQSMPSDAVRNYSQAMMATPPDLNRERYYFNDSYSATTNNLVKTGKGNTVVFNAGYFNTSDLRDSRNETSYMLPDSSVNRICESISNVIDEGRQYGDVSYKVNNEKVYIKTDARLLWDSSDVLSDVNGINQDYASKSLNASGKFTLIRRTSAKTGYEVILDGFYSNNGHSLNVSPGMKQTVGQDNMRVRGGIGSFRKMNLKGVLLSPRLAFDYRRNALASDLTGVVTEQRTSNDIAFDVLKISPSVDASYNTTRLNAYLSLPLSYEYMALNGNERMTKHSILPEPTLSMSYVFSSVLDGEMSYGFVRTAKDIATLYDGLIMRNYRTLTAYQPDLTRGYSNTFSAKLNYKDVFKMMFAGAGVYYSLGRPKVLYGYNYDGIYAEAVGMRTDELSHSVRAEVDFSKGFHWANTTVKAEVDVIVSEHPYLAQDRITRTRSNVVQLGVYLTMEPWKWMNLSYSGEVMRSQSLQPDGESFPVLYTGRNDLNLRFRLPYHFSVGTVVDNYINGRATGKKSFTLIDAEVHYEYRKMKWTLSCRNLLGVREYGYSRMSGGTDFFSSYMIRPREFMLKLMITI